MSDLVERLRDQSHIMRRQGQWSLLTTCTQAADRIEALEAQIAAADRLAGFAQGVVDRWDSQDWRSGHTLDFITALRTALTAYRAARVQP